MKAAIRCAGDSSLSIGTLPPILENKENTISVRQDDGEGDYTIVTLTVSGGVLQIDSEFYEGGELVDEQLFILFSSSDDVDALEICPDEIDIEFSIDPRDVPLLTSSQEGAVAVTLTTDEQMNK